MATEKLTQPIKWHELSWRNQSGKMRKEILHRATKGERPVDIARHFSVDSSDIRAIVQRRNWSHVVI